MKVFVRERPTPPSEPRADLDLGPTTITMRTPRVNVRGEKESEETTFTFDSVFDRTASQEAVFDAAFLPQVRNLFSFEDDEDFENEPDEEQAAPALLQVQLNYDDDEVLMHADWRAWQLLFLSHNHVFEYMGS